MGFFDQDNTTLETVWFAVLAVVSAFCFPFGVRLARRFPQIVAVKLVVSARCLTRFQPMLNPCKTGCAFVLKLVVLFSLASSARVYLLANKEACFVAS